MKQITVPDTPEVKAEALREACWKQYYAKGGNEEGFELIWRDLKKKLTECFAAGSTSLKLLVHGPPLGSKYRRANYTPGWDVNRDEAVSVGYDEGQDERDGWDLK